MYVWNLFETHRAENQLHIAMLSHVRSICTMFEHKHSECSNEMIHASTAGHRWFLFFANELASEFIFECCHQQRTNAGRCMLNVNPFIHRCTLHSGYSAFDSIDVLVRQQHFVCMLMNSVRNIVVSKQNQLHSWGCVVQRNNIAQFRANRTPSSPLSPQPPPAPITPAQPHQLQSGVDNNQRIQNCFDVCFPLYAHFKQFYAN